MRRQDFSRLGIELYLLVDTDINLRKVVAVEALAEHLSSIENIVLLQFLLCTEDIPSRVQLLVLSADGLRLLVALRLQLSLLLSKVRLLSAQVLHACIQACHITVESADGLIELSDVYVLRLQFSTQLLQFSVFLYELSLKVLDGLLHLVSLEARLAGPGVS